MSNLLIKKELKTTKSIKSNKSNKPNKPNHLSLKKDLTESLNSFLNTLNDIRDNSNAELVEKHIKLHILELKNIYSNSQKNIRLDDSGLTAL